MRFLNAQTYLNLNKILFQIKCKPYHRQEEVPKLGILSSLPYLLADDTDESGSEESGIAVSDPFSGFAFCEEPEKDLDYYIGLDRYVRRENKRARLVDLVGHLELQLQRKQEEIQLGDYLFQDLRQELNPRECFIEKSYL